MYEIEILPKSDLKNSRGEHTCSEIKALGVKGVQKAGYSRLYRIEGDLQPQDAQKIASELLSDKITEKYLIRRSENFNAKKSSEGKAAGFSRIEVFYKKGVTDGVAESVAKAVKDLGIKSSIKVKTGDKYYIYGDASEQDLNKIASKLLANTLIQEYSVSA